MHKPFHTMYVADCKKYSLFLNFTPYFHDCKKLLLSFEFYPLFSWAGGKLLFWKNPSEGSDCDRLHILITFIYIITPLLPSTHKPVLARAPSSVCKW